MQVASIVPIPYLDLIKGKPYQMCLAHLALTSDIYADFYREESKNGSFVLMDNGAAENAQLFLDALLTIVEKIAPTELVLPDVIYEGKTTVDLSYRAMHKLKGEYPELKLMAVPQGRTVDEWLDCALDMLDWPIDTIGISKFASLRLGPCIRSTLLGLIQHQLQDKQVHMLGCAYDPRELGALSYLSASIRGTDSAIPYVYASQGHNLVLALQDGTPRYQGAIDFFERKTNRGLISSNIQIWEQICNGKL